jgi:hypothetical protein
MKTQNYLLQTDKSHYEVKPKTVRSGKVLKSILVMFMLSWVTILSSCMVAVPHQRNGGPGVRSGHTEQRGGGERRGGNEHKGGGEHKGGRDRR